MILNSSRENLKLEKYFGDKENKDKSLLRSSTSKPITSKNEELNNLIRTIESLEPDNVTQEDNLTTDERIALSELMKNKDLVIKPADKGVVQL